MVVASIQINPCSLSFNIICSFVEYGTDLFKKLEQDSLELMIHSTSNIFFIPNSTSTFSYIFLKLMYIPHTYEHVYVLLLVL